MGRAFAAVGRVLVVAGILMLLFVLYQLWGTGLYANREQSRLRDQFETALSRNGTTPPTLTTPTTVSGGHAVPSTTTTTAPAPPPPPVGDAVASLRIPSIGVDSIVVNGVGRDDLRSGPGHYPGTPLPGQEGNAAIAGHRTTYGAPFGNLDQLNSGDRIIVRTLQGTFTFQVYATSVVDPSNVSVLEDDPTRSATLTLTTCTPKYSAAQRLVVKAELVPEQVPLPAPDLGSLPKVTKAELSGDPGSKLPTLISGLIALLVGLIWWLAFHRHPSWRTWILAALPFLVALFFFYVYLERVLPANY